MYICTFFPIGAITCFSQIYERERRDQRRASFRVRTLALITRVALARNCLGLPLRNQRFIILLFWRLIFILASPVLDTHLVHAHWIPVTVINIIYGPLYLHQICLNGPKHSYLSTIWWVIIIIIIILLKNMKLKPYDLRMKYSFQTLQSST